MFPKSFGNGLAPYWRLGEMADWLHICFIGDLVAVSGGSNTGRCGGG